MLKTLCLTTSHRHNLIPPEYLRNAIRLCLDSDFWYWLPAHEKAEAIWYAVRYADVVSN